jgi:hypothetical protein
VTLQRTAEQLMAAFTSPQATMRGETSVSEPAYTLVRSEFLLEETTYSLIIEAALHEKREDVLTLTVNIAAAEGEFHPLVVNIKWGEYQSKVQVESEGRKMIDDLPLGKVFDEALEKIVADLQVTLTAA